MTTKAEPGTEPLAGYREAIDRLDDEFIGLLARRMELVRHIGGVKKGDPHRNLRDEEREREIFQVWAKKARTHGLSPYFVGRVLRELLNYSRRDQERVLDRPETVSGPVTVRVAYQGTPGSYSDLAISKLFATRPVDRVEKVGFQGFGAALDALQAGQVHYALLPIENTVAGSINEVYDLLAHCPVTIVGEEVWKVEHCLLGLPGASVETLETVRSHPVALQQCRKFLDGLVGTRLETYHDTAGAAQSVAKAKKPTIGAIASEEAAGIWGLKILRRDVADQDVNLTRFLLIGTEREPADPRRPAKTSLVLAVRHTPGALLECLRVFDDHGINLSKLESRPLPEKPWAYRFYVDFEGHADLEPAATALQVLRGLTHRLKVLGTYTRRTDTEAPVPVPEQGSEPALEGTPERRSADASPARSSAGGGRLPAKVGDVEVGGSRLVLIGEVDAATGQSRTMEVVARARDAGVRILCLGGAREPVSVPKVAVQTAVLETLGKVARAYELPVAVEVQRPEDVARTSDQVNLLVVSARNMQNHALLEEMGRSSVPVLLKRGLSATLEELLQAAEEVITRGNHQVILCERGIRTFETATASTLDLSAVPLLKARTPLPVVVDPGAAADPTLLIPLARAAVAVGADGLFLDLAGEALACADGLESFCREVAAVAKAVGRSL